MDLFYCTNAINYTVAAGLLARAPRRAVLLYERRRFGVRPLAGVWQTPISANTMRLLGGLSRLRPFGTVHVPHHKVAKQFAPLLARAPRIAYLDDGLDTLRKAPANVDLGRLRPDQDYHTFTEYRELAPWLARVRVQRSASLADVPRTATAPRQDLSRFDHVFIESPGLEPQALVRALALDPARVLVIRHPVVHKRGPLPEGCTTVTGNELDCEGSLLAARGKAVYCGETMVFILLHHLGAACGHRLWLQLPPARWDGLAGLPPMREVSLGGVGGRLGVLDA